MIGSCVLRTLTGVLKASHPCKSKGGSDVVHKPFSIGNIDTDRQKVASEGGSLGEKWTSSAAIRRYGGIYNQRREVP